MRTTSLIMEHFGFNVVIKVVDEVVTAMNNMSFKGVEAFEKYLLDVHAKGKFPASVTVDSIKEGTAKLESLIQSNIDDSFDKYELYCVRNIFSIPPRLVEGGWIRLKQHEGVDFASDSTTMRFEFDQEVSHMYHCIEEELHLRKIIKLQTVKMQKIVAYLNMIQRSLLPLSSGNDLDQASGSKEGGATQEEKYNRLQPLESALGYLRAQLNSTMAQVEQLSKRLDNLQNSRRGVLRPSSREKFVENRTMRILQRLGLDESALQTRIRKVESPNDENGASANNRDNSLSDERFPTSVEHLSQLKDINKIV
ncbi:uncharacterized protein LODBEIA_P37920 [Lodderomyces beijingensis]|uniref:Uncharacterized protein n=1 Tax=Lodderomyces beijingensis TaxID=1775926 RepID=A0ABP0ZN44_9ASCO